MMLLMGQGPLSEPRLAEIESKLNAGRFDEAQRLLSTIFDLPNAEIASAYFATRLLFQRGRLDRAAVVERLRELLARIDEFPEAERMLAAAETGVLEPSPEIFRQVTGAPSPSSSPKNGPAPALLGTRQLSRQDIPRAPPVPRFTPRTGTPSYVPMTPQPPGVEGIPSEGDVGREAPDAAKNAPIVAERLFPRIPSLEIPAVSAAGFGLPNLEASAATAAAAFVPPIPTLELELEDFNAPRLPPQAKPVQPVPAAPAPPEPAPPEPARAEPAPVTRPTPAVISTRPARPAPQLTPTSQTLSTLPPPSETVIDDVALAARRAAATERPDAPNEATPSGPSLFEIAAALDAGHPKRALELSERAAPELGPELTLLTARALVSLGEKEKAFAHLERLLRAVLIEPLVRSASARLLIELGRPEQALIQARRAAADDPTDPVSRATLAWALVRVARRTGNPLLGEEVENLLSTNRLREGAIASLLLGLRAAAAAEFGDATRAVSLAQTALQHDPRQVDALAAIAVASARLGLRSDAQHAQARLEELNPEEAAANVRALLRHGLQIRTSSPPEPITLAESASVWGEAETALRIGQKDPSVRALVRGCTELAQKLNRRTDEETWPRLARSAARLLTELPVLRHFSPFDCSVFSVDRLEAALALLFDQPTESANEPLELVLGAYLGECYRQAFGAEWQGAPALPLAARIDGVGISMRPCERVRARLREGKPLAVDAPRNLHPGADPMGNSVPLSLRPPAPWDPKPWPLADEFLRLGRLLPISVVGYYCSRTLGLPLDRSVSGIVALDRYLALLAPPKAPPDPDGAWLFRVGVLLGAYIGEVLVEAVAARWEISEPPNSPDSYRLVLPHGAVATPVNRVLERLAGRRPSPLSEYVTRLASGRPSIPV
jgi:tetratricopeptide (TPR) repeat protein